MLEPRALLQQLGWQPNSLETTEAPWGAESWSHPAGLERDLGDLVDRGPFIADSLRIPQHVRRRPRPRPGSSTT
ncbi:MAG: hypothetical protein QM757_13630 [Paludibaculum sp.]